MKIKLDDFSPILKIQSNNLRNLPSPSFISYIWNFGALLGITRIFQIITGIFLSINYIPRIRDSFSMYMKISRNIENGILIKYLHINMASIFFVFVLFHIFRGILNKSFKNYHTWIRGVTIYLLLMASAFLGYILPWGQISLWGATVITNLISSIPFIGNNVVIWLWGGFSVSEPTLNRFFSLHFLTPLLIIVLIIIHLIFLHEKKSSNQMGLKSSLDKTLFSKLFLLKDLNSFILFAIFIFIIVIWKRFLISERINFSLRNPLITPKHIVPEWYFLFGYAILRRIPNKLGGVLTLLLSIFILFRISFFSFKFNTKFNYYFKLFNFSKFFAFIILTILGAKVIEYPYLEFRRLLTIVYFFVII